MTTSITTPTKPAVDRRAARAGWMAADQATNSVFNLLLGVAASWALSTTSFGVFSVMFAAYLLIRGAYRSLVCEPILILHADDPFAHLPTAARLAFGTGATLAAGLLIATAVTDVIDIGTAAAGALLTALLLLTDAGRIVHIRADRPQRAALISAVLLIAFAATMAVPALRAWSSDDTGTTPTTLAPFLTFATIGVVPAAILASASVLTRSSRPDNRSSAFAWVLHRRATGLPLLADFGASAALSSLSVFALAAVSLTEAGAYRAGQMVAAPIHMLFVTVGQFIVTDLARSDRLSVDLRPVRHAMVFMMIAGLGYVGLIASGTGLLANVLGESAPTAQPALVPVALFAVASFPSVAGSAVLRAQNRTASILVRRVASLPLQILAVAAGVWRHSALDVAIFGVIALALGSVVWIGPLRGGTPKPDPTPNQDPQRHSPNHQKREERR